MLKTIQEYNAEVLEEIKRQEEEKSKTGVACPECGLELRYTNSSIRLMSNPPQTYVECNCGYSGRIYVL